MIESFEGKTYIVTGASSGIGRAVCIELSRQKANVVMIARNEEKLNDTLTKMETGNHMLISFNLSDIEKIEEILADVHEKYEVIDGIVYCAGINHNTKLKKTTYEVLHSVMLVNYYAFIELVRCEIDRKSKDYPSRIVVISSAASILDSKDNLAYSASKAAVESAVRVLSTELRKKNTNINAIRSAYVETEMLEGKLINLFYEDFSEHIKQSFQPLGLIDPFDVAKMSLYLLSDAAKSITGMHIPINGGVRWH